MADVTALTINRYPFNPTIALGQTGNQRLVSIDVTWGVDTETYPSGGITVTAFDLGISALSTVKSFLAEEGMYEDTTRRDGHLVLDLENSKLLIKTADGTAASGDVGAWKGRALVIATEP